MQVVIVSWLLFAVHYPLSVLTADACDLWQRRETVELVRASVRCAPCCTDHACVHRNAQAKNGTTIDIVKSCLYKTSVLDALNVTDQVRLHPALTASDLYAADGNSSTSRT